MLPQELTCPLSFLITITSIVISPNLKQFMWGTLGMYVSKSMKNGYCCFVRPTKERGKVIATGGDVRRLCCDTLSLKWRNYCQLFKGDVLGL